MPSRAYYCRLWKCGESIRGLRILQVTAQNKLPDIACLVAGNLKNYVVPRRGGGRAEEERRGCLVSDSDWRRWRQDRLFCGFSISGSFEISGVELRE